MAYDGKLLAAARDALENIRSENMAEHQRRVREIYYNIPEIRELDSRMRAQMTQLVKLAISRRSDTAEQLERLKNDNLALQQQRRELLKQRRYPDNYLDDIYTCPKCRDTGVYENEVCSCLKRLYNRELTKELAVLIRNGNESFENFRLDYYPDLMDTNTGVIPRRKMEIVYAACKKFADNFPKVSTNLLLQGGTGLGKTYLSACIARTVASKGYSVCYDSAASALDAFEKQKFSRDNDELTAASERVNRMLSCDLMILDDLGTEMPTPMAVSALYTLINTRLVNSRPMVISTNLSVNELQPRYSEQIASRIEGEFLPLLFAGNDIRKMK